MWQQEEQEVLGQVNGGLVGQTGGANVKARGTACLGQVL